MKLSKIYLSLACAAMLASCSDDFLENKPQGSLSDGVMDNPDNVELLINAAYSGLYGYTNEQGDPWIRPITNWSYGEVRADNAYKGGGGIGDINEYHLIEISDLRADNGNLDGKWFNLYSLISRCNTALRILGKTSEQTLPTRDIRIAEMKVLRCHWYFELVRQFNKIPYMDENVSTAVYVDVPNDEFTRDEHLQRIADELLECAKVLPDRQDEVGRMNGNIARAYAAKVKLYQAYEQDPATNAVVNINKTLLGEVVTLIDGITGYDLLPDFQQLDLVASDNGPEAVFQIQHSVNDGSPDNGRVNFSNTLNGPQGVYGGDGFFLPSQDLINAYQTDANGLPEFDYQSLPDYGVTEFHELPAVDWAHKTYNNDVKETRPVLVNVDHNVDPRLDFVTGRPTITYKTYTEAPYLLWVRDRGTYGENSAKRFLVSPESPDLGKGWPRGTSALNWNVIRYADLLLYKAEALIEIGDAQSLETARTLINRIRNRAKESAYVRDFMDPSKPAANYNIGLYPADGWTQDYARKALRTEMRLEKALEGERFFDLVRWGIAKQVMNRYFECEKDNRIYYGSAQFTDGNEYFPIPVAQYNFSLNRYTQNPGYPAF